MKLQKKLIESYGNWSPVSLVHTSKILFRNKTFADRYQLLNELENWKESDIQRYQLEQVQQVVNTAYSHCPFYRDLYRQHDIAPGDIQTLTDFHKLPVICKLDVKKNVDLILNGSCDAPAVSEAFTGGSTGNPMRFFVDDHRIYQEKAYFYYIWEKHGYRMGDRCVFLKGDKIAQIGKGKVHQFDAFYNYLRLDSDYLNKIEYLNFYDRQIRKFGARFLFGFPSSIYQLALLYSFTGKPAPRFDAIFMASENTYDDQNAFISEVFGAKDLFFHYGHSEYAILAYKYHCNDRLGFVPLYGYAEVTDANGNPLAAAGKTGELVATSFANGFPIIRYKTSDYATTSNYQSDDYMRNYKSVKKIQGRLQEYIVTSDKRLVSIVAMGAAHFSGIKDVTETQYYQDTPGKLRFRIVEGDHKLSDIDLSNIISEIEKKLEGSVSIELEFVDEIKKSRMGKKSMIDQRLDISQFLHPF